MLPSGETGHEMITTYFHPYRVYRLQHWLFLLILCCALMVVAGTDPVAAADEAGRVHIVRSGETLTGIARRYQVGVQQLASYNGITNLNRIRVGQRLRIPPTSGGQVSVVLQVTPMTASRVPSSAPPTPTPRPQPVAPAPASPARSGEVYYTVYAGDSLTGIGARFGVSASAIMSRNRLPSTRIYVGQRLIIPTTSQPSLPPAAAPTPPTEPPVKPAPVLDLAAEPTPALEFTTTLPTIMNTEPPVDEADLLPAAKDDS